MNKKTCFALAAMLLGAVAANAVEIKNMTAGTLARTGINVSETKLTVSGEINASDFHYILDNLPKLESLNLADATITAYTGPALPYTGLTFSEANRLPDYALTGMTSLRNITLPKTLKAIGKGALSGTGLTSLTIPDGVETVGDYAAMRCESLTNLKVNGIASLGTRAFANCSNLQTIEISAAIDRLPEGVFEACGGLKKIDLSALTDCRNIGEWAFADCNGIETLILPESTVSLAAGSLYGTSKISVLSLPANVNFIGDNAMGKMTGMKALLAITVDAVPELGANVWANVDQSKVELVVATGRQDDYRNAEQWQNFKIINEEEWNSLIKEAVAEKTESSGIDVSYANGSINIKTNGNELGKIAVFNSAGMRMVAVDAKHHISISVNGWPKGVYLVVTSIGAAKVAI